MSTFYSILYAVTRPQSAEKVAIGLLLANDKKVIFNYSQQKINLIRNFLPENAMHLLKDTLRNIHTSNNIPNDDNLQSKFRMMKFDFRNNKDFDFKYINYLSVYNNNLYSFSKPNLIDIEINDETFNKLFIKFINDKFDIKHRENTEISFHKRVINSLKNKINNRVFFDVRLTSENIVDLPAPVQVDFIGKNEKPVIGKSIDFSSSYQTLEKDIAKYFMLIHTFENNGKENSYNFLIGDEPEKKTVKEHELWSNLRINKNFKYVPTNEIEQITEYANNHNVRPYMPHLK